MSPGQRFMTDLLVGSLMADGGLEATLDASIKIEMRDIEERMIVGAYIHTYVDGFVPTLS